MPQQHPRLPRSRLLVDAAHGGILIPTVAEVGAIPGVGSAGRARWSGPSGGSGGTQPPPAATAGSRAAVGGGEQQQERERRCQPHSWLAICAQKQSKGSVGANSLSDARRSMR